MPWDATTYFENLTRRNRLAQAHKFATARVTTLDSLEEALHLMQNKPNIICISEMEQGYTEINNSPHIRRVKTIYMIMRHPLDDMRRRMECISVMNELFRQFCSDLIREKTRLEQNRIYLDPRIRLNEVERYMLAGAACLYFQVATDEYVSLQYDNSEWTGI